MNLTEKKESLKENIRSLGSLCVAFSGGVDSTYLLALAKEVLGDKAIAVTVHSSMNMEREFREAESFAKSLDVRHIIMDANEYSVKEFVENGKDRCYYCKYSIFTMIKQVAAEHGISFVADGSNADDTNDYRPGMRAIQELEVVSPLKCAGLTKAEIRELSKEMGLPTWDKPSFACLASRIPYGVQITPRRLAMVGSAEELLMDLGFRQLRVRYHGEVARIELPPEDMAKIMETSVRERVVEAFKKIGFTYVALDLVGYRTGSMNEVLDHR